jgi:hypothetical protein
MILAISNIVTQAIIYSDDTKFRKGKRQYILNAAIIK